jgi:hypothetical protein
VSFRCGTCGQEHVGMPMDVGFGKPADYFALSAEDREHRCVLTSDWCSIDDGSFYIRGCLEVPVTDADGPFVWGIWARVAQSDFQRYLDLYSSDGSHEPPFVGHLCGEHRGYEGLDGHAVMVQLRTANQRPAFFVERSEHLLYREQQQGISLHRVHEILVSLFPDRFH